MKRKVKIILLVLLLIFNVLGTYISFEERFITRNIISKEVTIIDKYTIGGGASEYSLDTTYMKGIDKEDNIILICGDEYDIGDTAIVYINENSVNANSHPEWRTSIKTVDSTSTFGLGMFLIFTVINIRLIILSVKDKKECN